MPIPDPTPPRPKRAATTPPPGDADPDRAVRRRLHAHGLRFGVRARDLPGRPEIVLPRRRAVVFVHDCFWHGHGCALDGAAARFNAGKWAQKIAANQAQDARNQAALRSGGWQVETVWECQVDDGSTVDRLAARLLQR